MLPVPKIQHEHTDDFFRDLDFLFVLGTGRAEAPQPDLFPAQARATIRYADPAAWITAAAVARAVAESGNSLSAALHETGIIVVSDQGPGATMAQVQAAMSTGFSSPLRYAASNPGSMAGVTCIAMGFRGPTLYLAMPPEDGVPVALNMCASWLARGTARYMVLATFQAGCSHAILIGASDRSGTANPLTPSTIAWLINGEK